MNITTFVPIRHEHLAAYYRTPVWVERGVRNVTYTVSVGDYTRRMFDENTAPNMLKAVIAMVDAFPWTPAEPQQLTVHSMWAYTCPNPKQMEIGWRVTNELYMLVLPTEFLEDAYIRGENG